jgi:hypothetical protein
MILTPITNELLYLCLTSHNCISSQILYIRFSELIPFPRQTLCYSTAQGDKDSATRYKCLNKNDICCHCFSHISLVL